MSLYYILDDQSDPHYADCLVELDPTAYIWYRLRQDDHRQNIVFFRMDGGTLHTETFDPESEEFLNQPAGFLFLLRRKPTDEEIFEKLLSAASSSEPATLVFTHEAFCHACRISNAQGQRRLEELLEQPNGHARICVRLPQNAGQLASLVHMPPAGCGILRDAYAPICQAADTNQLPLLEVLTARLGQRLLRYDRSPGEMKNLLMMHAVCNPKIAANTAQLEDQAAYLDLCRKYRIAWLAVEASPNHTAAVSRKRIDELLHSEAFLRKLSQRVAKLRSKYGPDVSMEHILRQERLILDDADQLVCDDSDTLANSIRSLTLPEEFLQHSLSDQMPWSTVMEQIRRNLTIVWNKPRNEFVSEKAAKLCGYAAQAIYEKIWPTLDTTLRLLHFFSKQICLPPDQTGALEKCWIFCENAISLSNSLYGGRSFGLPTGYLEFIDNAKISGDKAQLDQLKFHIHQTIRTLETPSITVTDMVGELEADRQRVMEELRQANRQIEENRRQREAEEQQRREAELLSRYNPTSAAELQPEDDLPDYEYLSSAAVQPETPFRHYDKPSLPGMSNDPTLRDIGSSLWPESAAGEDHSYDENSLNDSEYSWI